MDQPTCADVARAALGEPAMRRGSEILYHCPCPAHRCGDKNPSLSVNQHKNTWFCGPSGRGGNAWELAALLAGCDPSDKSAVKSWLREHGLLNGKRDDLIPVAEYVYRKETGEPVSKTIRYETPTGKTFRQFRPNGNGKWVPGLEGVKLIPYRLNEWQEKDMVFPCEGEKCADALWEWGIPSTCNPMGAGKWRSEYNAHFAGKRVVILPDNDPPGEAHARDVAGHLFPAAKAIKIVRLPDVPAKGDIVDWIAAGGTREQFLEVVKAAPPLTAADVAAWKPSDSRQAGFNLVRLRDLLSEPEEKVSWIVQDRLPSGGFSILAGKPKAGKSTLARCLALAVARGEPFLGWATVQGPVIYLALEEKRSEVRAHFRAMGASGDEPILIHAAQAPQDAVLALGKIVKEHETRLIIVDPLLKMARVRSEKEYAEVSAALEPLLNLARESGAHLLAVYHSPKADRADLIDSPIGSTAFAAAVDTLLVLKRTKEYRTLATAQRCGSDLQETVLEFDSERRTTSLGAEKGEAEQERIGEAILEYLSGGGEAKLDAEIDKEVEGKTTHKRVALRELVKAGEVVRSGKGKSGDPYRYEVSFSCSTPITGTREQDMENEVQPPENKQQYLVPDIAGELQESTISREQDFLPLGNPDYLEL